MQTLSEQLKNRFMLVGHLEGISFLLLLGVAMPLKYLAKLPIAVTIAGSIHGILFVAFCFYLYKMYDELKWPLMRCIKAFLLGFLPFGTFFLHKLN